MNTISPYRVALHAGLVALLLGGAAACNDDTPSEFDLLDTSMLVGDWQSLDPERIDAHLTIDDQLQAKEFSMSQTPSSTLEYTINPWGNMLITHSYLWCGKDGVCSDDEPANVRVIGRLTSTAYIDENTFFLEAAQRQDDGTEVPGTYVLSTIHDEGPAAGGDHEEITWSLTLNTDGTWGESTTHRVKDQDNNTTWDKETPYEETGTYEESDGRLTLTWAENPWGREGGGAIWRQEYIWRPGAVAFAYNAYTRVNPPSQ